MKKLLIFSIFLILSIGATGQVYIDLKQLKDAGIDINQYPPQDLLSLGIGNCDMELVKTAISKGADLNRQIEGAGIASFPLCMVISAACSVMMPAEYSIISTIIKEGGADVYSGRSAAELRRDYLEMIKFFIQKGAKVNVAPDFDADNIPLLLAVKYRDTEIVRLLLDSKADPNSRDMSGNTALHILGLPVAVAFPYKNGPEIARLLISKGAKMTKNADEEGGPNGSTPLALVKSSLNIIQSGEASFWKDLPFYNELSGSLKSLAEIYSKP